MYISDWVEGNVVRLVSLVAYLVACCIALFFLFLFMFLVLPVWIALNV